MKTSLTLVKTKPSLNLESRLTQFIFLLIIFFHVRRLFVRHYSLEESSSTSRAAGGGGLRFRGGYRIPGKLRHYSGNLRDMREVVTFDAFDGQFAD